MTILFIGSTGDHAGQTLVAWAIAQRLKEKGLRIDFFKPFGTKLIRVDNQWTDPDAYLFKKVFQIAEPLEMICPFTTSEMIQAHQGPDHLLQEIKSIVHERLNKQDFIIILGSKHIFFDDVPHPLPDISIITELNAHFILAHRFRKISTTLYSILSVVSLLKEQIKGLVINRVADELLTDVQGKVASAFSRYGTVCTTVLPENPLLSLWSIKQIQETLHGEIIWGEEFIDRPVEGMTVGSTDLRGQLSLFKRVYNKIILIGPSQTPVNRKDSSNTRTIAGILLTGNRDPAEKIVEVARESNIPLILVKEDSFTAKECLDASTPNLTPADQDKVIHFTRMMDHDDSLNRLIKGLGV